MGHTMKYGDIIEHLGTQFVVIGIRRTENAEGSSIDITALDKEMASREQHKMIKMEETREGVIDMLGKFVKGEGGSMGFGFGLGGERKPGDE